MVCSPILLSIFQNAVADRSCRGQVLLPRRLTSGQYDMNAMSILYQWLNHGHRSRPPPRYFRFQSNGQLSRVEGHRPLLPPGRTSPEVVSPAVPGTARGSSREWLSASVTPKTQSGSMLCRRGRHISQHQPMYSLPAQSRKVFTVRVGSCGISATHIRMDGNLRPETCHYYEPLSRKPAQ